MKIIFLLALLFTSFIFGSGAANATFSIPSNRIIFPNGGEILKAGMTYNIEWEGRGVADIQILKNGKRLCLPGTGCQTYVESNFFNVKDSNFIEWTVPEFMVGGEDYQVLISYSSNEFVGLPFAQDTSDAAFSVVSSTEQVFKVLAPNERWQTLEKGKSYKIKWLADGLDKINLILYKGKECSYSEIIDDVVCGSAVPLSAQPPTALAVEIPNTGVFQWTVPDFLEDGDDYWIAIQNPDNLAYIDQSNFSFLISAKKNWSKACHPSGTLINENGSIFEITSFGKFGFNSAGVFLSYGHKFSDVVPASECDLNLPSVGLKPYADGDLIVDESGTIFIIYSDYFNWAKAGFVYKDAFEGLNYKYENVYPGNLFGYGLTDEISAPFRHEYGTLVNLDGAIFVKVPGGGALAVPSMNIFRSHKFRPERIILGNQQDRNDIFSFVLTGFFQEQTLGNLGFADGSLLSANGTVYFIENGTKRGFVSEEVFLDMGYKFENVIQVSEAEIDGYDNGQPLE